MFTNIEIELTLLTCDILIEFYYRRAMEYRRKEDERKIETIEKREIMDPQVDRSKR